MSPRPWSYTAHVQAGPPRTARCPRCGLVVDGRLVEHPREVLSEVHGVRLKPHPQVQGGSCPGSNTIVPTSDPFGD